MTTARLVLIELIFEGVIRIKKGPRWGGGTWGLQETRGSAVGGIGHRQVMSARHERRSLRVYGDEMGRDFYQIMTFPP